jgi:16S rRNA A1518/A1519 N6-dimethyltransferase RsmA/KsgA/DIM1 with predicted DNA glycosylase/AP lyase activity
MADHIRIGDVAPRIQYAANGVQTAFTYPFPIFSSADLEVRLNGLLVFTGFSITGAGLSEGGQVVFDQPPGAGTRITLRRHLKILRNTDFQQNGVLRARILNDELDYQVAALQEAQDGLSGTIRLDPSEYGATVLPLAEARANRILGFDATGDITVFPQGGTITSAYPGAVPRSAEDKFSETLSARDFGSTGNGATDDGLALQAAMNAAAASGKHLFIGEGTHRTTMALNLPGDAAGLTMRGVILYAGPDGQAALTLGSGGEARNANRRYEGLRVLRASQSDWSDEADIGIVLRNLDASHVEILQAEGFTIGLRSLGDQRGFEDSTLHLGRIANNKIGLDVRTGSAAGWNNSITYLGGHFAVASGVNPTIGRFGVRFSCADGGYDRHNQHLFLGPAFELQRHGTPGSVDAIPFLVDVADARCITALQSLRVMYPERFFLNEADALTTPLSTLAEAPRSIVANLPYNVGTQLVVNWLRDLVLVGPHSWSRMVVMLQKEVAERMVATPGSKAYGRLSVLVGWLTEASIAFDVPPGAFHPPPKVTSSVLVAKPRSTPLFPAQLPLLERVVAAAFNQRRKMLRSSLKSLEVDVEALCAQAGVDSTLRAEACSIAMFCALAEAFSTLPAFKVNA